MKVYLDNAATTPIDPQVLDLMHKVQCENYGNPSSIHTIGRKSRTLIEKSRKKIASILGVAPGEIFFTSGGTEADNMALQCAVHHLGCKRIITSAIEHHAVLHTCEELHREAGIQLDLVSLDEKGRINLEHLETLLKDSPKGKTIVSLMHANNEIGNMIDLLAVGNICEAYGALFHSDTVQTIGHWDVKPKESKVHFLAASAHKFNGPKGIGFIYLDENVKIRPMIHGGSQERNMRGGTENIGGIVGLCKALELSIEEMETMKARICELRAYFIEQLEQGIPGVSFNGDYLGNTNYIPLNVSFPVQEGDDMLLFNLDIAGIAASGGSACSSGSDVGSHVLAQLKLKPNTNNIRFSFGKYNTKEDIDLTVAALKDIFKK